MSDKKNHKGRANADIVVVSMLPKIELQAILAEFARQWPEATRTTAHGSTSVYEITTKRGWNARVAVRSIQDAGNLASAIETTNLLSRFFPRFAFLCGIAGNINHEKRRLGDVVVSNDYSYRLASRMSEGRHLEWSSPSGPAISRKMRDLASNYFGMAEIDFDGPDVGNFFPGKTRPHLVGVEVGKIFCWDMVLDCNDTRQELIAQDREFRAVEMEAVGFLRSLQAFSDLNRHAVDGLIFRGLSDPASGKSNSDASDAKWRPYAARNAARSLVHFIDSLSESDCEDTAF